MVKVLIISDIRLYREGLAEMLACDGRLEVVGATRSIDAALTLLETVEPDVALLDVSVPGSTSAIRAITLSGRAVKIVALGVSETRSEVVKCAEAGARGYLCRESSLEELVTAVQCAVSGELYCPPWIAAALMESVGRLAARAAGEDEVQLTCRELEIAEFLNQGLANHEIALRLHIAVTTVKVHVHHILDKLGTRRRGEAAAKLRRLGLLCTQLD